MKRAIRYIILSIFFILLLTGITLIPLCIFQFIRYTDKHFELNDFYDDHSIYQLNPIDNSGTIELSSPISLPDAGRFALIIFCYDTTKQNTNYNVELNINASINGISNFITLKDKSYIKSAYPYNGDYIIDPKIEKSWKSNEHAINSTLILELSWESNFEGWDFYVLYTNDLIEIQFNRIKSARSNALIIFGFELGFSIVFIVAGAIVSILSIVFILKNRVDRKIDNSEFHNQDY